ncbi:K+ channel tetramerisation domain protein [Ancylostoma ceylanicum]|uniref:K+ channel tetramerisation domain protein n=1 Tax=Ancylostoma ceylanicum TaxID=53326 RepID=A0A0D6LWY1_9BILA|nr:K+ channel tetramerisation domain protein [Ancylostoma ceylanicum]
MALEALFKAEMMIASVQHHGHLFIDRDSTIFPLILNYLRDSSIPLPRDEYYLERILREARFFKLHSLCADVERRIDQLTHKKSIALPRMNGSIGEISPSSIRSETTFDAEKKSPRTPGDSPVGSSMLPTLAGTVPVSSLMSASSTSTAQCNPSSMQPERPILV